MIKAADLAKDVNIKMGDEVLVVISVKQQGRKTIAVCKNLNKNRKEEHSVSDLYYGKAKIVKLDAAKPLPKEAKEKQPKGKSTITYFRRGEGIVSIARDSEGKTLWTAWVRKPIEKKKAA